MEEASQALEQGCAAAMEEAEAARADGEEARRSLDQAMKEASDFKSQVVLLEKDGEAKRGEAQDRQAAQNSLIEQLRAELLDVRRRTPSETQQTEAAFAIRAAQAQQQAQQQLIASLRTEVVDAEQRVAASSALQEASAQAAQAARAREGPSPLEKQLRSELEEARRREAKVSQRSASTKPASAVAPRPSSSAKGVVAAQQALEVQEAVRAAKKEVEAANQAAAAQKAADEKRVAQIQARCDELESRVRLLLVEPAASARNGRNTVVRPPVAVATPGRLQQAVIGRSTPPRMPPTRTTLPGPTSPERIVMDRSSLHVQQEVATVQGMLAVADSQSRSIFEILQTIKAERQRESPLRQDFRSNSPSPMITRTIGSPIPPPASRGSPFPMRTIPPRVASTLITSSSTPTLRSPHLSPPVPR
mmetsp:Transcript_66629/g.152527  ORF Transcript_66629/g.152527 Transcript_66629/m.152527 type:complete len:419 (+) Transcript_66629:409-1665(+)